jgi:hypothetical protein
MKGAVLADLGADLLVLVGVPLLQRLHSRIGVAAFFQNQLGEAVAGAGGGGRPVHLDRDGGQAGIDVAPRPRGLRPPERVRGQALVDVGNAQVQRPRILAFDQREAVDPDRNLDDQVDAVFGAALGFAFLDPPRRVGHVGIKRADAVAEQLHPGTRAGRFDDRRGEARVHLDEALGDRGRERIDGRGADDLDLVARAGIAAAGKRQRQQRRRHSCPGHVNASCRPERAGSA